MKYSLLLEALGLLPNERLNIDLTVISGHCG